MGFSCLLPARTYATAGINSQLSFEGKIVNSSGVNIADGTYNMEFKIYRDGNSSGTGSTLLWTEDYLVAGSTGMPSTGGVTLTSGTYQVNLGSICVLAGSTCGVKTNTGVDFNQQTLWLSLQVGNTSACTLASGAASFTSACGGDNEMTPFVRLTATPYAFNADKLDGLDAAALGQLAATQTWTGTNTFQPTTNINSLTVIQTSAGSPTADIFDVQTANNTNVIQVAGPSANNANVTINPVGSGNTLSLGVAASNTTIQIGATNSAITDTISIGNNSNASGGSTIAIGSNGATGNTVSIDAGTGAGSISIGSSTTSHDVDIGAGTTGTNTSVVTIGSANAAASTTTIQGGNGSTAIGVQAATSGTISVGTTNVNTVTIGSTANTGTLTFGRSTAGEIINIGNGNVASGKTNTISIGATATSTGLDAITIGSTVAASSLTLQAGSGNMALNVTSGTITLATTTSGAINLTPAAGNNVVVGTSNTSGELLVLDTDTDATISAGSTANAPTEVDGGMFYSSTSRSFLCGVNGAWVSCIGGLLKSNTSVQAGDTITGSGATAFATNYAMPANYCTAGRVIRITAAGVYGTGTSFTATQTMQVNAGATALATQSVAYTPVAGITNKGWMVNYTMICNAAPSGASAIESQGIVTFGTATVNSGYAMPNSATANFATNGSLTLQVESNWSNSLHSPTITMRQFIVEGLGP